MSAYTRQEREALFQSEYTVVAGSVCTYCGDVCNPVGRGSAGDHVPALADLSNAYRLFGDMVIVPCCARCNGLLSDSPYHTVQHRKEYIKHALLIRGVTVGEVTAREACYASAVGELVNAYNTARDGEVETPKAVALQIRAQVELLYNAKLQAEKAAGKQITILFACAGIGGLVFNVAGARCIAVDIKRANCTAMRSNSSFDGVDVQCADLLTWSTDVKFDLIIMNPPFTTSTNKKYWRKFVEQALSLLSEGGQLIAVLPKNTGHKTGKVILDDVVFENARSQLGQVVIMQQGEDVEFLQSTGVRFSEMKKYGVIGCEVLRRKGEENEKLKGRAIYFNRNAAGAAFIGNDCGELAGNIVKLVASEDKMERMLAQLKTAPAFRKNFDNPAIKDICAST